MRIAVFGADGQVGRELAAIRKAQDIAFLRRTDANLAVSGATREAILSMRPDAVINAAAWTAVDKAETEYESAFRINAAAVGEIASACAAIGARLVHISTDYVFSGSDGDSPLSEMAAVGPLNVYGQSKLEGEQLALASGAESVILRTSWVYSVHGANFVKTMLRLADTREEISVVDDQIGGPTPASAIAAACLEIAGRKGGPTGLYHFQGAPPASWAEFARAIFQAGKRNTHVKGIPTAEYPTPARRPLRTVLDCAKVRRDFGVEQPDWRADIVATVSALDKKSG
jgi:dTDP-4-dehydrorhamnose reductase